MKKFTVYLDEAVVEKINETPGMNFSKLIRHLLLKHLEDKKNG